MTGQIDQPPSADSAQLYELPPSAKLVAKVLEHEGELTQSQLAESTLLPTRTVRSAVSDLEERNIVASRSSVMDARKQIYFLTIDEL